jgi:hypothetical protein
VKRYFSTITLIVSAENEEVAKGVADSIVQHPFLKLEPYIEHMEWEFHGKVDEQFPEKLVLIHLSKKSCHNCGLEDVDFCEAKHGHRPAKPADGFWLPCQNCVRNPEIPAEKRQVDNWHEGWVVDVNNQAVLE